MEVVTNEKRRKFVTFNDQYHLCDLTCRTTFKPIFRHRHRQQKRSLDSNELSYKYSVVILIMSLTKIQCDPDHVMYYDLN